MPKSQPIFQEQRSGAAYMPDFAAIRAARHSGPTIYRSRSIHKKLALESPHSFDGRNDSANRDGRLRPPPGAFPGAGRSPWNDA